MRAVSVSIPLFLSVSVGLSLASTSGTARAGEQIITLDGQVADGDPRHAFVPFDVPAGIVEIEVDHDDMSDQNILDWGLLDDQGKFRGWGGGNTEDAIVASDRTSRSYITGPIAAGSWQVVIGKALISAPPATYHLVIHLRDATTLATQPERGPYTASPALASGQRWYGGDLHVHSKESGDAKPSLDEIAALAETNGLDFVELSDHNTVSQLDFIVDAQSRHPTLLFLPGIEWTSYAGHANGIGATQWVDHKLGINGVTAQTAADAFAAQGALFSINHPTLGLGNSCIGCAWDLQVKPSSIDAVEVINGAADLFTQKSITFWDDLCATGQHIAAVGGSDDHTAGQDEGLLGKPIGTAMTMVFADELSAAALIAGIRAHRTVVRRDPQSPMVELTSSVPTVGDTIMGAAKATLHAKVTLAMGDTVHFVHNGTALADVTVDADPFETDIDISAPDKGEDRWRVEVWDGSPRTITSHLWIAALAAETTSSSSAGSTGGSSPSASSAGGSGSGGDGTGGGGANGALAGGGCGCAVPGGAIPGGSAALLVLASALARRRRLRA